MMMGDMSISADTPENIHLMLLLINIINQIP